MSINPMIPATQMPAARMTRIHWHWTASPAGYTPTAVDAGHYHFIYGGDGKRLRGKSIKANEAGSGMTPASHTLKANTGAIGLSVCAMGQRKGGPVVSEKPFRSGEWPMTEAQMMAMLEDTVTLCTRYGIPVTPRTVLSHAEVEANLGIKQRGKWDIARISFKPELVGAKACGDWMRAQVVAMLDGVFPPKPMDPAAKPARFVVTGVPGRLNFRRAPNGEVIGSLKNGDVVERLNPTATEGDFWWNVRTRGGHVGWVASDYLAPE